MTDVCYEVNFRNNTDRVWTIAVYQTLPNSPGLDSVSWLQATAPSGGSTRVQFDISFIVSIADYRQDNGIGVYEAAQVLSADLGTAWQVVFEDGVQQLKRAGKAPLPQQILIENVSGRAINAGIGMSGRPSVYQRNLTSGAAAQFYVTPTYHVGLFNDVVPGEVISSNVAVGPKALNYPSGATQATVTADLDGGNTILSIDYGSIRSVR